MLGFGLAALLLAAGCTNTKPVPACITFRASPNLNPWDGHPHAVTLYLYPLSQSLGFDQMRVEDLLQGTAAPGATGTRLEAVVNPGEEREIGDQFDMRTTMIGIVVDYYRAPGEPTGTGKLLVEADCGWGQPEVILAPNSVLRN